VEALQGQPVAGGGAPIKGVAKLYRRVLASYPQNVLRTRVPPPLTLRYPSPGCAVTRLAMSAQETAHISFYGTKLGYASGRKCANRRQALVVGYEYSESLSEVAN